MKEYKIFCFYFGAADIKDLEDLLNDGWSIERADGYKFIVYTLSRLKNY